MYQHFKAINDAVGIPIILYNVPGRTGVETLLPPSVSPYDYNLTGPGGVRHQSFNSRQVTVQQRLPHRVSLELAYFRNHNDVEAHGMAVGGANLRADPNLTIPAPDGSSATVPNPHAGQMYLESLWFKDWIVTDNEIYRLSAAWEAGRSDRWFGRHRVAGLAEHSGQERLRRWRDEILVDDTKDRKSTRLNSSHGKRSRMPSSA